MKRPHGEPERWSERLPGSSAVRQLRTPAEDEVGALLRRVKEATVAPSLEPFRAGAVQRPGRGAGRLLRPLALAALIVALTGGVVKAARAVWRAIAAQPQSLVVPRGSRAVLHQRRHRKLTVLGPAHLDLDRGGADRLDVTLDGGEVTAESGDQALLVQANGLWVTVPAGASGRVAGTSGGVASVEALGGEVRVAQGTNGATVAVAAGHRWPEPPPPARSGPAPAALPAGPPAAAAPEGTARPRVEAAAGRPHRKSGEAADSEATLVARAFQAVRVDRDAASALRALDERARRFPDGTLADEARVARVEALLALERTAEALPLLLEIRDRSQGLTREIQVARAEILAAEGRCAEALADFDDLLSGAAPDDAGERALYGRAGCRLRAGEATQVREDLRRYLQLYPRGRFAGAVARAAAELNAVAAP
jgi:tetratricopeptide (TPR) repeat protein